MMRLGLLLLLAIAVHAQPVEYRVQLGSQVVNVYAHDGKVRADYLEPGPMYDSLLSRGGDVTALNSTLQTYFRLDSQPFALQSRFLSPGLATAKPRKVKWAMEEAAGRYKGTLSYVVPAGAVSVRVAATIVITTDVSRERRHWIGQILPVTGYKEVDALLAASDAKITGIPTTMTLHVDRTYEGGPTMSDSYTVTTSDFREAKRDHTRFERPAKYRFELPVIAFPDSGFQPRKR